jgi:hypothetical protein
MRVPLPVFIAARFRSGSTMLWKFFRSLPGTTAYYEPLNPELLQGVKFGPPVQPRHFGVSSYYNEYRNLGDLPNYFTPSFGLYRFYLTGNDRYDELKGYIRYLLESAQGLAVLKFNRIDFRLAWIRKNFPSARIVHLHRDVRDQWRSSLGQYSGNTETDVDANPSALKTWCDGLLQVFPFLSVRRVKHAYQRHYYLWKLSYLFGRAYCDVSVSYEEWISRPKESMRALLEALNIEADVESLYGTNPIVSSSSQVTPLDRTTDKLFEHLEQECEAVLNEYGLGDGFNPREFEQIRRTNPRYVAEDRSNSEGYLRQLEFLHQESCGRLTQIYEKEKVIRGLVNEVDIQRSAAAERLKVINILTAEVASLKRELRDPRRGNQK